MKDGFRQRMAWLHTWCGLVCGWLLCAIFLTGTLSVFRDPITRWMEARPVQAADSAATPVDEAAALGLALRHLAGAAPGAQFWRVALPAQPGDALQLSWRLTGRTLHHATLDAATGAPRAEPHRRQTEGGRHFMSFHYSLHGGMTGFWVVGWISMCMLVALVSGVVVHKRIFQDFFTFRPGKGQRSWLDAHNATAVLALPFLFMIVYTGLAYFYTSYMPWPARAAYGWDDTTYNRFQAELAPAAPPAARRARTGTPAALPDMAPLLAQAQALTGRPAAQVVVERPGDAGMVLRVVARSPDTARSRTLLNAASSVAFDGVSGAVLEARLATAHAPAAQDAHHVIEALHVASFGGWTLKWLYFASGLAGTAMVATGTLLFAVKRRKKSAHEFGAATARFYRGVEALNVVSLAGTALASIAYLYGNRLMAAGLADRSSWEIRVFFAVWLASLLHALLRPPARAWVEQLALGALLCLGLPWLNRLTTGQHLLQYASAGDWQRAGLELTAIGFGLLLACAAWKTAHAAAPQKAPARTAAARVARA